MNDETKDGLATWTQRVVQGVAVVVVVAVGTSGVIVRDATRDLARLAEQLKETDRSLVLAIERVDDRVDAVNGRVREFERQNATHVAWGDEWVINANRRLDRLEQLFYQSNHSK